MNVAVAPVTGCKHLWMIFCKLQPVDRKHSDHNSVTLWQVKLKIQTFLLSAINCFICCIRSHEASDSDCVPNHYQQKSQELHSNPVHNCSLSLSSPSPSPLIPIPIGTGADNKVLWATTPPHSRLLTHHIADCSFPPNHF